MREVDRYAVDVLVVPVALHGGATSLPGHR
jgi:hypothetical protein